jgi:hypothetical protein
MYIPPEVVIVPTVFLIPSAVVFARMWFKHREKMAQLDAPRAGMTADLEARLARIEHAMDAMAIEMERVGEGQRFLTKVLSDPSRPKLPAASEASGGR